MSLVRPWCAALVVGTWVAGCTPQATLPPETFAPIKIGIVTSLTGPLATDGPAWRDAAELAALELNAAGGPLPGRPIELVVIDDETNPLNADAIAARLLEQEEVVAIVGAPASSIALGIAEFATPAGIPQISCCSTSDRITAFNAELAAADRYYFRTAPADILQAQVVTIAAREALACGNLAILHLDDSYGVPFAMAIEQRFRAAGGTVVARVSFADEQTTYATQVQMIAAARPDCVALVAFPGSGGTIIRDWAQLSDPPEVTWIGTDGVRGPGIVDEVGDPRILDGFYGTSPITDAPTPEYNAFRANFRAVFGADPIPFAANQYDAMALLGLAIARAGSTEGAAIRDAIRAVAAPPSDRGFERAGELVEAIEQIRLGREIDYQGASGGVDFDELGGVVTPYEIWRYDAPTVMPCANSTVLPQNRGSFCRFRTINAESLSR